MEKEGRHRVAVVDAELRRSHLNICWGRERGPTGGRTVPRQDKQTKKRRDTEGQIYSILKAPVARSKQGRVKRELQSTRFREGHSTQHGDQLRWPREQPMENQACVFLGSGGT